MSVSSAAYDGVADSFSVIFALVFVNAVLPASYAAAQAPSLFWTQHSLDVDVSTCAGTAIEGLTAGTMYNVTAGAITDSGSRSATGSNSNLSAVVACRAGENTVTTIIVAGSPDHVTDAISLGDYLSNYMLGEQESAVKLSSSEAPVKMYEWLTDESSHGDWAEWRVGIINYGRYEIVLRKLDASAGSTNPNEGEIQVLVR